MADIQIPPALQDLVNNSDDKLQAIANFVVDNNEQGVFTVLRQNGYNFNTHGEAAVIVRSILAGKTAKTQNEMQQLARVPYINDNQNGTGGLQAVVSIPEGGAVAYSQTVEKPLLCVVSTLFGLPLGCTVAEPVKTPEQIEAERKAAEEATKAKQRNTLIIAGAVVLVIIIIAFIYFKNKDSKKEQK